MNIPGRSDNFSQESQCWLDHEMDVEWHSRATGYGPGDGSGPEFDTDPDLPRLTEEETAVREESARVWRLRDMEFKLAGSKRLRNDPSFFLRQALTSEAATLSSGTIGALTGLSRYDDIDVVQRRFVRWCHDAPAELVEPISTWQQAWTVFWKNAAQS